MNIAEYSETEVNEMSDGSDKPDLERMSTQDYLEALLNKNGIPRTKKPKQQTQVTKTKSLLDSKKVAPKTPPAEHEEPAAPTQSLPKVSKLNTPLAASLAIEL